MIPGRDYSFRSIVRMVWAARFSLVLVSAVGAGLAAVYVSRLPVRYRSSAAILVTPQLVPQTYVRSTVNQDIDTLVRALSERVLERNHLAEIVKQVNPQLDAPEVDAMVTVIQRGVTPQVIRADAFRISFVHDEPLMAARITGWLARAFVEQNLHSRTGLADDADEFMDSQLQDTRARLTENERRLEAYRRLHAGELPSQVSANVQVIQNAYTQLQSVREAIRDDRDRKLKIEQTIASLPRQVAAEESPVADTDELRARLLAEEALQADAREALRLLPGARATLQRLGLQLKPNHPDMVRLQRAIAELERRVATEANPDGSAGTPASLSDAAYARLVADVTLIDQRLTEREAEELRLRSTIERYQERIEMTPTRETELMTLMRDYDTIQESYRALLLKKEQSKMAAELERRQVGESLKIVEPALVPREPFSPNKQRIVAIGALLGFVSVLLVAAVRELLDTTFRNEREVVAALDLRVLAMIPIIVTSQEASRARLQTVGRVAVLGLGVAAAAILIARFGS